MDVWEFELIYRSLPQRSSWFRRLFFQSRKALSSEEEDGIYEGGQEALRTSFLNESVARIDPHLATAAQQLIEAIEPFDNVVIRLGNILLVKYKVGNNNSLFIEKISQKIAQELEDNPALLRNPEDLIEFLESKSSLSSTNCSDFKDRQIKIYRKQCEDLMEILRLKHSQSIENTITVTAKAKSKYMSETFNIDQRRATNPNVAVAKDNARQQVNITNLTSEQKQSLDEAAAEIQQLLEQLSQTNPTETLSQKAVVAEEAIKQIENDPSLRERVISAIKAMGIEALMEAIDHPVANVLRAGIEAFKEPTNN